MSKYGQFCPVARALEILGDRWTLLIIRDLLTGTTHFNELERGLPGISRALLASRLRILQNAGIIEKRINESKRQTTSYQLTRAGQDLIGVIMSLREWGEAWAFGEPQPDELDPVLLMWWMRQRAQAAHRSAERVVIQFDFVGPIAVTFWLVLTPGDASLCLVDPGYGIDLLLTSELATFFKLHAGRISYREAVRSRGIKIDGAPRWVRAFPAWFGFGETAAAPQQAIGRGL